MSGAEHGLGDLGPFEHRERGREAHVPLAGTGTMLVFEFAEPAGLLRKKRHLG